MIPDLRARVLRGVETVFFLVLGVDFVTRTEGGIFSFSAGLVAIARALYAATAAALGPARVPANVRTLGIVLLAVLGGILVVGSARALSRGASGGPFHLALLALGLVFAAAAAWEWRVTPSAPAAGASAPPSP